MKLLWIALLTLTLTSCASYHGDNRNPASDTQNIDSGITAESYIWAR